MSAEQKIRTIFNKFDQDGSGEISARELVNVMRESVAADAPEMDEEARDVLAKKKASFILVHCDKNQDLKMTWDEFYGGLSAYVD